MKRRELLEALVAAPIVGAVIARGARAEEPADDEAIDPAECPGTVAYQQAVLRNEQEALAKWQKATRENIREAKAEAAHFLRGGTSGRR